MAAIALIITSQTPNRNSNEAQTDGPGGTAAIDYDKNNAHSSIDMIASLAAQPASHQQKEMTLSRLRHCQASGYLPVTIGTKNS
eukprot:scaffold444155_cov18-Prasinocladus_malaysianus.AAC.1